MCDSRITRTHNMKQATWHQGQFIAQGCNASSGVDYSVTLQAGMQFADFYPQAEQRGRLVNGGTCTSVGVGGCTLGGCFGSFSNKLGPSASNVLEAKVVIASGELITASKCSYPDLFWALRGGGSGFGVVTEWTMRSYKSPAFITKASFAGSVGSGRDADIMAVAVEVLRAADVMLEAHQGWNGDVALPSKKDPRFSIGLSGHEGNATAAEPLFVALKQWIASQPASMKVEGKFHSAVTKKPSSGTWIKPGKCKSPHARQLHDVHTQVQFGFLFFFVLFLVLLRVWSIRSDSVI